MAREKTVVRQAEICVLTAADYKSIVLVKGEHTSGLRARDDVQSNAHQLEL